MITRSLNTQKRIVEGRMPNKGVSGDIFVRVVLLVAVINFTMCLIGQIDNPWWVELLDHATIILLCLVILREKR